MGLLAALNRASDRYNHWYDTNVAPKRFQSNFPKCWFCGSRNYRLGSQTVYASRVWTPKVRATATCMTCGMRYQASRNPDSKRWSFTQST